MNKAGSKRKAAPSKAVAPPKRSTKVLILPLHNAVGIKRRGASLLILINDVVIDVFNCLSRKDLDTLQNVSRRFSAMVANNMTLVCLRLLMSASMSRSGDKRQFVLIMDEVGAKKKTRLPTGVDDEAAATALLLNACRSSRVYNLELYGTTPMSVDFFDFVVRRVPTIFLKKFCIGKRTLSSGVPNDKVLEALQAFAELNAVITEAGKDVNLLGCLIRTCFKAGVTLISDGLISCKQSDTAIVENALLEFCFGACDEKYAEEGRFMRVEFSKPLKSDFVQRWIEQAEIADCRHQLLLGITIRRGLVPQDTAGLDAYKANMQTDNEARFESVTGRNWAALCSVDRRGIGSKHITFAMDTY
ncbi:hypothetical protein AAVH_25233 [Aphelenchoides avenae]|nr:hypothetical protein AAVH_25233 [Aphelenchus avenae]